MAQNVEIDVKIVKEIGVISTNEDSGWTKELNLVSWNGKDPKYDIRDWSPNHERMSKGVTLTEDELNSLKDVLNNM